MEGHPSHPQAAAPVGALPSAWLPRLRGTALLGAVLTAIGWLSAPSRLCPNLLLASFALLGLGLGALLFLGFGAVTRAGWHVALRRIPEALAGTLPASALMMLIALAGLPWLYEWSHGDAVAKDPLLQAKSGWLDAGFFLARAVFFLALWLLLAALFRRLSRRQDETGNAAVTGRTVALAAVTLLLFAYTFSAAAFDWLMSLEPHWYSTVFAAYHFSGLFVAALAVLLLLSILLRRRGALQGILRDDHLHDLAKMTLGFSTFWAYLWYCQHMLIWYSHIPEETVYYAARMEGAWGPLFVLTPVVNWLIPFLALLPRPAKRSERVLVPVALLLLLGRWLDLYVGILPPFLPAGPALGLWEIAPLLLAVPLGLLAFDRCFRAAPPVPAGDPYLVESLHHRS